MMTDAKDSALDFCPDQDQEEHDHQEQDWSELEDPREGAFPSVLLGLGHPFVTDPGTNDQVDNPDGQATQDHRTGETREDFQDTVHVLQALFEPFRFDGDGAFLRAKR